MVKTELLLENYPTFHDFLPPNWSVDSFSSTVVCRKLVVTSDLLTIDAVVRSVVKIVIDCVIRAVELEIIYPIKIQQTHDI